MRIIFDHVVESAHFFPHSVREDVLQFREFIMPPSKVCPQCETIVPLRLKVCKSCEYAFRACLAVITDLMTVF